MLWPFSPRGSGKFDFPATTASSVTVVVKELAKANASYWLWQIRVALGRSNSFKLQQSTHLQGSQRLSMAQRSQTLCTNEMYESLVRTRLGLGGLGRENTIPNRSCSDQSNCQGGLYTMMDR